MLKQKIAEIIDEGRNDTEWAADKILSLLRENIPAESPMTTENVRTKISKEFTFSAYTKGTHVTKGWLDNAGEYAEASFVESLSPLHKMIEAFSFRPLGIKIRVIMEEVD